MTAPRPVADSLTPAERFEAAVRKSLDGLIKQAVTKRAVRIRVTAAEADRAAAAILRAADLYAGDRVAAEAQAIARTPRSQMDPMQPREDGDVA